MTYPLKPGYMNCVLEKLFSASRQVLLPPCSFTANIEEQRVTNRVIYDAAGTGRSCQNDNNSSRAETQDECCHWTMMHINHFLSNDQPCYQLKNGHYNLIRLENFH